MAPLGEKKVLKYQYKLYLIATKNIFLLGKEFGLLKATAFHVTGYIMGEFFHFLNTDVNTPPKKFSLRRPGFFFFN